ncbi:hypothetical protein [Candidatus Finniella inopinata]|uniref:Uncharacterized protein n=1 Tax=Candidatus Finniella inopinata TaxID=1696036 RepID=A0A4Q7DGP9_9PROT|nr:hypothetical protein [Candidatus Finniella inopinata]RZI45852.1 hypothetical protein EQU50_05305 [Candidatus Finniella inopinata]
MNRKILFLLLGASCSIFLNTHKAWSSQEDSMQARQRALFNSTVYNTSVWGGLDEALRRATQTHSFSSSYSTPSRTTNPTPQSNAALAAQAVAIACKKPTQDFFGFDPRYAGTTADFQREMSALQRAGGSDDLLKDWISQPNAAVKLTGFLNSFGETLATADSDEVEKTLQSGQSVNPENLLDKAYNDMARLISGQVVQIDEKRTATKEEERVLLQAAANLGRKKAAELGDPSLYDGSFEKLVMNELLEAYNLLNPTALNKTTLRHNTILLNISLSAALGRAIGTKNYSIHSILSQKGFNYDLIGEVDTYLDYVYSNFSNPGYSSGMPNLGGNYGCTHTNYPPVRPIRSSEHIADIVSGKFESYNHDSSPAKVAKRALKGIELLGLEPSFVQARLDPYRDQGSFDALRNPNSFIQAIRTESQSYTFSPIKRTYFDELLNGVQQALLDPNNIHNIPGFGHGSVAAGSSEEDKQKLTKQTWLNSAHDFVIAYLYAKSNGCLEEFYSDATPSDSSPCLPGKIRTAHEWYESKTMLVNDIPGILEKVFAGEGGIQLDNAVQQLYRKYVWMCIEIFSAEPENKGITAKEAPKNERFKREHLTLETVKEWLGGMVQTNLAGVIEKYRKRGSMFPISAFHAYKYNNIRLTDGLSGGHMRLTTQQAIQERQAQANQALINEVLNMVDTLGASGAIEIYDPFRRSGPPKYPFNLGVGYRF